MHVVPGHREAPIKHTSRPQPSSIALGEPLRARPKGSQSGDLTPAGRPAQVTSAHALAQAARTASSCARAASAFVAVQWDVRASGAAAVNAVSSMGEL